MINLHVEAWNIMKYVAVCFTDEKFLKTRERYVAEMASKNIFSEIYSLGPTDIQEEFLQYHQDFIDKNPKGYGYFIWKPYIIYKILSGLDEGDILVYGDSGNTMPGTREQCLEKFDIVKGLKHHTKILGCKEGWNIRWTKTDLYFRMGWHSIIYAFRIMPAANRVVICKDATTMKFVKDWMDICKSDYRNIDDSPSRLPSMPFFWEHRYDQSVFGILFHKYHCKQVDFENVWLASRLKF